MRISRTAGSLLKPWGLVQMELEETFGEPEQTGDEYRWAVGSFRLFEVEAVVNPPTGQMEVVVSTTLPYSLMAIVSFGLALLLALVSASTAFVGSSIAFAMVVLPLAANWRFQRYFYNRTSELASLEEYSITPVVLLPLLGFILAPFLLAEATTFRVLSLVLALFLFPFFVSVTTLSVDSLRRQFPAWGLVFFSSLPILLTMGNFWLLAQLTEEVPVEWIPYVTGFLVVSTLLVLVAYAYLCRLFLSAVRFAPNEPISSTVLRTLWWGYFLGLNAGLVLLLGGLLFDRGVSPVADISLEVIVTGFATTGLATPTVAANLSLLVLGTPLLGLTVLWVWNLIRRLSLYRELTAKTKPTSQIDGKVPVRVLETAGIVAHPFRTLTGEEAILISRDVIDELSEDELEAVIAHETYHLRNRDLSRNAVATVFGLLVGGTNALVAIYDYPKIEREADEYAASQVGADALVRALRRLDSMRALSATRPAVTGNHAASNTWLISAPYRVLFGSIILENAHASIDERVAYVIDRTAE